MYLSYLQHYWMIFEHYFLLFQLFLIRFHFILLHCLPLISHIKIGFQNGFFFYLFKFNFFIIRTNFRLKFYQLIRKRLFQSKMPLLPLHHFLPNFFIVWDLLQMISNLNYSLVLHNLKLKIQLRNHLMYHLSLCLKQLIL
jgi:hypothetical protein